MGSHFSFPIATGEGLLLGLCTSPGDSRLGLFFAAADFASSLPMLVAQTDVQGLHARSSDAVLCPAKDLRELHVIACQGSYLAMHLQSCSPHESVVGTLTNVYKTCKSLHPQLFDWTTPL